MKFEPFEETRETTEEWQNVPKSYDNYQARSKSRTEENPIYVDASKTLSIPPDDFSVIKPIPSRNWINSNKKKNIKEGENTEDILENTYQSVDHPKMKKRRYKKGTDTEKYVVDGFMASSFDLDREINKSKTSAAMFEDLTKQSCNFLASTISKNTAIRLQKVVTSPTFTGIQSRSSHATTSVSNSSLSNSSPHHIIGSQAPPRSLPQPPKLMEETEFALPLQNLDKETSLHDHTPTGNVDYTIPIQSNVSENIESNHSTSQLVNSTTPLQIDDSGKFNNPLFETCDHEELLKKISTLQLVVDDLKEKSPQHQSDVIDGNVSSPDNIPKPDDILQNRLLAEQEKNKKRMRRKVERRKSKDEDNSLEDVHDISAVRVNVMEEEVIAEKIRNKERIRKREKAKEARKQRRSPEVIASKNICDSTDERPDHTDAENKSSESAGSRRRSKLSKKKELWKKYARKRKVISSMESSATDLSAMSADDDERLVSSDTAENLKSHKHHNGSLEKNMFELSQSGLGVYPFPYLIGSNFDRVPPLRPHPPYTNPIFASAPLHTHNNLIFNQPALQMPPYGNFNIQNPPRQAFTSNNSLNNSVSNHSSGTNNLVTLPKLNNLVSKTNTDNSNNANNIVLPSGRGKPRENERVLKKADLEKLEKAQERAREKLKAFLDRANAEGLMDSIALNESVT